MPDYAMSFVPEVYEDDFGETHYNLANGEFKSSAPKEAVHQHNLRHQEDGWVEDEDGSTSYINTADDTDLTALMHQFGGEDVYASALKWAGQN